MFQYFLKKNRNKKFQLNTDTISIGFNQITISKDKEFKNPIVKLVSNGSKEVIPFIQLDNNNIQINLNIENIQDYKLLIKDGLKKLTLPLILDSSIVKDNSLKFNITETYKKGKIFFNLKNDTALLKDYTLKIDGELNKTIIWKKGTKEVNVNFVHQVIGFKQLKFNINGVNYVKTIINPEKFPSNVIKINNGIRINTTCSYDLVLKTDIDEQIIKGGTFNVSLNLDNIKWMKLYFRDKLLFEQVLSKKKFLPKITISDNPLKVKLSQTYYEDVHIKIEGFDKKFVIPQGSISAEIPLKKGLRKLVIENAMNAVYDKDTFIILLK